MSDCGHPKSDHALRVCFGQESNGDQCWCHLNPERCDNLTPEAETTP